MATIQKVFIMTSLIYLYLVQYTSAFLPSAIRRTSSSLRMNGGGHGEGFKYIPIHQGKRKENFPRIVQIAGIYPELSADDLLAPPPSLPVTRGSWTYDFSDPSGPQLGTYAFPPSDLATDCINPVAVISTNTALGIKVVQEVEVVLLIDRGDTKFKPETFFAYRSPDNKIYIKWQNKLEPGQQILGRVVLCAIPFVEGMKKQSSGFLEDEDDDDE